MALRSVEGGIEKYFTPSRDEHRSDIYDDFLLLSRAYGSGSCCTSTPSTSAFYSTSPPRAGSHLLSNRRALLKRLDSHRRVSQ